MRRYLQNIQQLEPYVPGDQPNFPDMVKLNTNENPYPPSPKVQEAMQALSYEDMRLYPDPDSTALTAALAQTYGVQTNQIYVGVGSDDVLAMIFQTFFRDSRPILFPDITYAFYPVWARLFHIPYQTIPLKANLEIDPKDYNIENGGIVFPNPNAPTGLALPLSSIRSILEHNPESLVIVDEAYVDFGGTSALPLLAEYENLLVVRTFSKSRALAGARIGFAIGAPELIAALQAAKYSFNSYTMNRFAQAVGEAALQDASYFQETLDKIIQTREDAKARFSALGFTCTDSKSNFLFVTKPDWDAQALYLALKEKHIYVRWFDVPRIRPYLRVTVGTPEQMDTLFQFLETYTPAT